MRLWRNGRSLARDSRQPSRIEAWSPESATTVSPGARIVPSVPTLAWWPVVNTIASSVPIHSAISCLELEMQRRRAVQQARAGQPGPVSVERVARARDHALVAGQPQVVVRAEHDPLGALHLHHRARRALEQPEVRQHVGLAGGAQLLGALVAADLGEDVDLGACHVGSPAVSVEVSPVRSRADLREFIELPFRLHSTSRQWVPPLRLERHAFLSRRQNAFFTHGDARLFLARRDGRVVGRISAQVDRAFNAHHGNAWGMFGFLEFEDDPEVLAALLDAARDWLAGRGRDRMIGPMDFSVNDELGVLIEGFDREPMIKQPWHPPYYARRLEEAGMAKAMDLLMWELQIADREQMLPLLFDLAEQVGPKHGITLRKMSFRRLRSELDGFADVYNAAWKRTTGASCPTRRPTSTSTPKSCGSCSTAAGSWSPSATARRSRSRSPCPDINQVLSG